MVHLDVPQQISRELPAWMLDASICAAMSLGEPQVSAEALALLIEGAMGNRREEVIEALAALLLEALGNPANKNDPGDSDEPEDFR